MAALGYSKFISWSKIILPALALGLLSSLVLFSKKIDPQAAVPFAETDVEDLAQSQRIGTATYATVTSRGAAITISALSALPDANDPNVAIAETVKARVEGGNVEWAELTSENALIDTPNQQATFNGKVTITSAQHYRLLSASLITRLDRTELRSPGEVTITGPGFQLQAGNMTILEKPDSTDQHLLDFNGGIKLIYQP